MGLPLFLHPREAMWTVWNEKPVYVPTEYICAHVNSLRAARTCVSLSTHNPHEVSGGNRWSTLCLEDHPRAANAPRSSRPRRTTSGSPSVQLIESSKDKRRSRALEESDLRHLWSHSSRHIPVPQTSVHVPRLGPDSLVEPSTPWHWTKCCSSTSLAHVWINLTGFLYEPAM